MAKDNYERLNNIHVICDYIKGFPFINKILEQSKDIYLVGGSIRDYLLNYIIPVHDGMLKDLDIVTTMPLDDILRAFPPSALGDKSNVASIHRVKDDLITLKAYNTTRWEDNCRIFDITELKSGGIYSNLSKRDFTMNAISLRIRDNVVIDPFNGIEDIKYNVIRCVGSPDERFTEDPLRMMRAIRFTCEDLNIDPSTYSGILRNASLISNVAKERITDEFNKILLSENVLYGIELLKISGLMDYIIPEFIDTYDFDQKNPHHEYDVWAHSVITMRHIATHNCTCESNIVLELRLAALLHDIGKPSTFTLDDNGVGHFYGHEARSAEMAEEILTRLKYSNKVIDKVVKLIRYHMLNISNNMSRRQIRKLLGKLGYGDLISIIDLKEADRRGSTSKDPSSINFERIRNAVSTTNCLNEAHDIKSLNINGTDIKEALNIEEGPTVGIILDKLLKYVINKPSANNKDTLIHIATLISKSLEQKSSS